jgi:hypothetical protein
MLVHRRGISSDRQAARAHRFDDGVAKAFHGGGAEMNGAAFLQDW